MHLAGEGWMRVVVWNHVWCCAHWDVAVLVDGLMDGQRLMVVHVRVVVVRRAHVVGHLLFVLVLMPHAIRVLGDLLLRIFCALAFENRLAHGNLLWHVVLAKMLVGVVVAPE